MKIRFFKINDLSEVGTGSEEYITTIESNVIPAIGNYVGLEDTFPREVANVYYYYDEDDVGIEVMLYTNPKFEN